MYKYNISNKFSAYAGLGIYFQGLPIYDDKEQLVKHDRDDDEGFVVGVDYQYDKNLSFQTFYKSFSKIGKGSGSSDTDALGSTNTRVGMSVRYTFEN